MQVTKPKKGYKLAKWYFGKHLEIPEEWEEKKLEEVIDVFGTGDWGNDDEKVIPDGLTRVKVIRNTEFKNWQNEFGKTGIVSTDEKLLQNQRVGNIFPTDNRMLDKKFLFFILISDYIQNQIWSFVSSSAQPNIGKSELDKIVFFKPQNISEQKQIASILSNVDTQIQKEKLHKSNLERLKKGLMQKLLTGQIRVKVR